MIKIEERADGVHICGYVNATGKPSRPIITPRGKVIEVIEERAFEQALRSNGEVTVSVDHDQSHIYASTRDNTLSVYEDAIGLHADVLVRDKNLIDIAKKGKIRGWSFGMYNVVDDMEQRADDIPIRHIKSLELDHITLVVHKQPCYAATSVEVRADSDMVMETRTFEDESQVTIPKPDYSDFEKRIAELG